MTAPLPVPKHLSAADIPFGNNKGFTLVELLVVLLIIGILIGVTLLSPVSGTVQKMVQQESSRLLILMGQIRDKALMDNAEYGFSIDESGRYHWWVMPYEAKEWAHIDEKPFQPFQLPNGLELHLDIFEQKGVNLTFDKDGPSVVFYSDYQVTPFSLYLTPKNNKDQGVILKTDGLSDVEFTR